MTIDKRDSTSEGGNVVAIDGSPAFRPAFDADVAERSLVQRLKASERRYSELEVRAMIAREMEVALDDVADEMADESNLPFQDAWVRHVNAAFARVEREMLK